MEDVEPMELRAEVTIRMFIRDGETEDQARGRLYLAIYDGLCNNVEHSIDFVINEQEIEN